MGIIMKKLIKRMWHWEWVHEERREFITVGVEMAIIFVIFLLYKLGKRYLFTGARILKELPAPFLALFGIDSGTETGNISFYLMYVLFVLNLWNIWYYGKHMIYTIDRDEISGSIYTTCGQWFSRVQAAWSKWGYNVLWVVAKQSCLYLWAILWMLAGSTLHAQRVRYLGQFAASWGMSIFIMLLFMSVSFLYAVLPKRNLKKAPSSFLNMLFWTPFIIGNLYKLRDIVFFLLDYLEGDFEKFTQMFGWLDYLHQILPLSLVNPFAKMELAGVFFQLAECLILCAAAVLISVRLYRRREFLG